MNWIAQTVLTATTAFAATNIDDVILSMLFFSQVNETFRPHHIVVGKYLGFVVLILASLPGFLGGLLIPHEWLGLLGILPIVIGFKQWFSQNDNETTAVQTVSEPISAQPAPALLAAMLPVQTYGVAAITVANGGDNIGVYVPLFASLNWSMLVVTLMTFLVLIALWCGIAYRLVQFPAISQVLVRYSHRIVPMVLIGLGLWILVESKSYRIFFR
jgi:cadmium resistance transport/sequestration family protein